MLLALCGTGVVPPASTMQPPSYILFFPRGSIHYLSTGENVLAAVASAFQRRDGARIFIAAHTDGEEARTQSVTLSPARAEVARQRLIQLGVPADRIAIAAYGDSHPLVANPEGKSESQNRRVEIVVH
jgi:outer membrane protein OmpA-like peptidoglycan-associated protein